MTSVLSALFGVNGMVVTSMPSPVALGGAEHSPQPPPMVLELPSMVPQPERLFVHGFRVVALLAHHRN